MTTRAFDALLITDAHRDRTIDYLQSAYADGRLDTAELDHRVGLALAARTRAELNRAFEGIAAPAAGFGGPGLGTSATPVPFTRHLPQAPGGFLAGLAHGSGIVSSIIGPGLVYATSQAGSCTRREAAKAFNFQLVSIVMFMITGVVSGWFGLDLLSAGWGITWLVLTVIGAIKAHAGDDWINPVMRVVPLRVLDEGSARR